MSLLFISKEYLFIGMRHKVKSLELILKVDSIMLLWRKVIPNQLSNKYVYIS